MESLVREIADLDTSSMDRSSHNDLCQQVLELKIRLLQLKRLLDWANTSRNPSIEVPGGLLAENQQLREELSVLQREVSERDEKIKQLEKLVNENSNRSETQVNHARPTSLQDVSIGNRPVYPPCQHAWGPCVNDHTHHHARRTHIARRTQTRSLSGGRWNRKRDSMSSFNNNNNNSRLCGDRNKGVQ